MSVYTLVKFSPKHLDTHDGEDEPKHKTHKQHVENGRDGVHESIDHYLSENN